MRSKFARNAAGLPLCLALGLALAGPAAAAERPLSGMVDKFAGAAQSAAGERPFKDDIEKLLNALDPTTHGFVKWQGADKTDFRRDGDAEIADFTNAHFSLGPTEPEKAAERVGLAMDHVELRRAPAPDGGLDVSMVFPTQSRLRGSDGEETTVTFDKGTAHTILDRASGRGRQSALDIAATRIEDKKTGDWISFGPLSLASKLDENGTGWTAPVTLALQDVKFFFSKGPVGGAIDKISYDAQSTGPDRAALNRLRDRLEAMRADEKLSPDERLSAVLDLLPQLFAQFNLIKGEATVNGLAVRDPTGKPMFAVPKASVGGILSGASGDALSWRITVKEDGLEVQPAMLPPDRVPHRVVLDFGLENVATAPLRTMLEAASKMREEASEPDKSVQARQQGMAQILGAAAMLDPVFKIYQLTLETPAVGIEGKAETKGTPISPKGYSANGDLAVRGFAALAPLVGPEPIAVYLPILAEIGTQGKSPDGVPVLSFRLAATPQKRLTINGNDVSAWFAEQHAAPGAPRTLRPAQPAMEGADVKSVQSALAAAGIEVPQSGTYDGATAAAVARFQKAKGLNINGVVDAETRSKLGA